MNIQVEFFRENFGKIPRFMGRIFVSAFGGYFLRKLARKVTAEGWETEDIKGTPDDDFDVSIVTRTCGLVEYLKSEGMTDYLKYCNCSDFLMFPAINIGLKQPRTIDSGACVYCMTYNGRTEIPESLNAIYGNGESGRDVRGVLNKS